MKKPKASDQVWNRIMHEQGVEIFESEEYPGDYYKVCVPGKRPKYFYGELAYADFQRYATDNISYSYVV